MLPWPNAGVRGGSRDRGGVGASTLIIITNPDTPAAVAVARAQRRCRTTSSPRTRANTCSSCTTATRRSTRERVRSHRAFPGSGAPPSTRRERSCTALPAASGSRRPSRLVRLRNRETRHRRTRWDTRARSTRLLDRCLCHDAQPIGAQRLRRVIPHQSDGTGGRTVKGFRDFLSQGNVVQLAVAFVIGGAFGAVVTALVVDVINPIIAIPFGKPNFDTLVLTINGSNIQYGTFITAVIAFVLIAAGVYFFFVVPYNRMQARRAKPVEANTRACPECLSVIPIAAHRCSFCTAAGRARRRRAERHADRRRFAALASSELSASDAARHPRGAAGRLRRRAELRLPDIDARDREPATLHLWIEDDDGTVVSTLRAPRRGRRRRTGSGVSRRRRHPAIAATASALMRRATRAVQPADRAERAGVSRRLVRGLRLRGVRRTLDRGRHRACADAPGCQRGDDVHDAVDDRDHRARSLRPASSSATRGCASASSVSACLGRPRVDLAARRGVCRSR